MKIGKIIFVFLFLFCGCVPSADKLKSEIKQNPAQGRYLEVAFIPQKTHYCGPASLAMLLNYYGCNLTQEEIAQRYFLLKLGGFLNLDLIVASKELGFEVEHGPSTWDDLREKIKQGDPVLVFWNYAPEPLPFRHFALVIGYFQKGTKEWVIVHSGKKAEQVMNRWEFERLWKQEGNWMMTVKPGKEICQWKTQ